ncbi:cytochrome P450 4c3 [Eupeodes corollae]|uniref:cytochrome P450 4c3 n=1 Tax=Eupeodes corollae TaxID=290404 RepID=UPI002492BFBA|nr:cytochrome P450 4c3 [Eupeodes corollae]
MSKINAIGVISKQLNDLFTTSTIVLSVMLIFCVIYYKTKRAKIVKLIDKIPGPASLPLLGNAVEMNVDHDELFMRMTGAQRLWGNRIGINRAWQGVSPYVMLFHPQTVEPILNTSKYIDKSQDYDYLKPWLGTGLLTSFGRKWHSRRKILTPAFHFKILDDFIDVFNEQSLILSKKLESEINNDSFNIFPYVTLCTLDIVCETAMGRCINAQSNSESDYVKAVYGIGEIIQNRQSKLWLQWNSVFRLTKNYYIHKKFINTLHGFSNKVIEERRREVTSNKYNNNSNNNNHNNNKNNNNHNNNSNNNNNNTNNNNNDDNNINNNNNNNNNNSEDYFGKKKRLAFLDLLIEASNEGTVLTKEDIREEVDTFMFEGHDTTSAAISWTLFLLGSHPEIQDKVVKELDQIFGSNRECPATMKNLLDMKYLENCIKDALRLYPSVPMMARSVTEDVIIGNYTVPAGTTALIMTYMLHRNPTIFNKPEQFNPDNFLPENCHGRHPFSYIPFSAGPRNCIGQKFAILEEKAVLSKILRTYKIEAVDRREDLTLLGELILRPKDGLKIRITKRI